MGASGGITLVSLDAGGVEPQTVLSSGVVANAAAVVTLPAVPGRIAVLDGFDVCAEGSTAALLVDVTVAGPAATLHIPFAFPAGVGSIAVPIVREYFRGLAAAAVNTPIVVTLPAGGAGNVYAVVNAHGHYI